MNRRNRLGRAAPVLALLVLAAIVTGVAASATTTAIPKQLTGKWTRRNGRVMTMHSNGKGEYQYGLGASDMDFSRVTAHRLVISVAAPCSGTGIYHWGTGTYHWKVANRKLTLSKIHDACEGRVNLLAGTWRRTS